MLKSRINRAVFIVYLFVPLYSQSVDLDKMLGEENAKMVKAQIGIYEDYPKTEFIRSVGERLLEKLQHKQFVYQFHLVPEMASNALALPGGYVFITAGLLPLIETESDVEGIALAADSGYNPDEMVPVLSRMSEAIEKATGRKEQKSYFNDHTYIPDRVKTIEQHASIIQWTQKASTSDNFLLKFDSLLFGDSHAQDVIQHDQSLQPDLNMSIHLTKDWNIENQPLISWCTNQC